MNATQEQWRPIAGYEGLYEVSDRGRVRSLDRVILRSNGIPKRQDGRLIATNRVSKMGYHSVHLYDHGPRVRFYVHTLVLETFVKARPEGMVGCHNDGNVDNNCVENLRWGTHAENNADILRHGRHHNVNKTECIRGHSLRDAYLKPSGGRQCRRCMQDARNSKLQP